MEIKAGKRYFLRGKTEQGYRYGRFEITAVDKEKNEIHVKRWELIPYIFNGAETEIEEINEKPKK